MEIKIQHYKGAALKAMLYGAKRNKGRHFGPYRGGQSVIWRDQTWKVYDADAEATAEDGVLLCLKRNATLARYVPTSEIVAEGEVLFYT